MPAAPAWGGDTEHIMQIYFSEAPTNPDIFVPPFARTMEDPRTMDTFVRTWDPATSGPLNLYFQSIHPTSRSFRWDAYFNYRREAAAKGGE